MATSLSEPLPPGGVQGPPTAGPGEPAQPAGRGRRLLFGPPGQPRWARPALLALLLGTALLYLWNLSISGNANSFYAASVWAGSRSWKALFFASLDPSNAITVDKPPAALWAMALSARIFGFHSWSMLLPQALEGIASVALLYAAVRRWFGHAAGLIAGVVLALTPVAAMMFRFNNPDAMLVLLMVLGCYCTVRAVESAKMRWLVWAGVAIGFAFLAKMLQGYIIIPALGLAYLVAAPTTIGRRLLHLLASMAAVIVSTGWFVLAVALWPASSRPFIGGSTNNSEWELALGYNGLGRIFGSEGGGGGGAGGFGGTPGAFRMFHTDFGGEISWLLPTALIAIVALVLLSLRAPRTDKLRAAVLIWGGWLLVNDVVFSYMSGIIHEYYTIALAPPIGALVGIGAVAVWRERRHLLARATLALMSGAAAVWGYVLLGRDASWQPWLRWFVLVVGLLAALGLLVGAQLNRAVAATVAVAAVVSSLSGMTAWTLATVSQAHTGSIPTAGPAGAGGMGGAPGGGFPGGNRTDAAQGGQDGMSGLPGQSGSGQTGAPGQTSQSGQPGQNGQSGQSAQAGGQSGFGGGRGGGMDGGSINSALIALLKNTTTRWAAAVTGDQTAAALELSSYKAVMAMGGWSGSDNSPTLAQFKEYVAKGEIHYLIASSGGPGGGGQAGGTSSQSGTTSGSASGSTGTSGAPGASGSGGFPDGARGETPSGMGGAGFPGGGDGERPSDAPGGSSSLGNLFGGSQGGQNQISEITSWVKAHYKAITVGGETVYDLTQPTN
jgi:4-amino-4-deoxy-L-arabinose transferase-like glycosyltransferase